MPSTVDWLRSRSDAELVELLSSRPDLMVPAPADLPALARRLESPTTARRGVELLDGFGWQVLQALLLLGAVKHPEPAAAISRLLGGPATTDDVAVAAGRLIALGLVRADGDGYRATPAARDALGRHPAGLGPPSGIAADRLVAALAAVDDAGRAMLGRLAPGPPVGTVEPGSAPAAVATHLVDMGLLDRVDEYTVLLPQEVGLALRGPQPLGAALPAPPGLATTAHPVGTVDGAAAGQALAVHARALRLLDIFGVGSIATLKAGGVGIVTLRRIAKDLGLDEHLAALHVELLDQAGLVTSVVPRSGAAGHVIPTQTADSFTAGTEAAGWALLAGAWLHMRRDPSLIGTRDAADKICNALSPEMGWRTGPAERHRILSELASLPPGTAADPESVARRLVFRAPLRDPAAVARRVTQVLAEAVELGVVAFGAMSGPGRALLTDGPEQAARAMDAALPPPVDTLVVQADMTVVAPGRLAPGLSARLSNAADVESAGGATVYRVGEASLRRALDAGATAAELHDLFERHSATPVPQSIGYLIDDVARRHGAVRAGAAGAYVRSDDPALIAQAVAVATAAGLALRALAPTVAVTAVDVSTLVEVLRSAGLAAAAEDVHGSVLDLRPRPKRTRIVVPTRMQWAEPSPPSADQVAAVVRRLRAGDTDPRTGQDSGEVLQVLREAVRSKSTVWIGYADAEGGTSRRAVEPIVVSGGSMVAFDRLRRAPRTFALHRISSARPE